MAAELRTYGDTSIKESVLQQIELLTALEDNLLTTFSKSPAQNTVHSSLTETLRTPASQAVAESAVATLLARTTPVRVTNLTEIVAIPFGISGTQRAVSHFDYADEYTHQAEKAMLEWKNAAEFDLVRSTLVSGASGTAPKMTGVISSVSTNATAETSGTIFSESIMNGLLQLTWTNSNGEVATDFYVGAQIKRKISGFAGRTGSQTVTKDMMTAVNSIDFYISDFGEHRVHLHRFVFQAGTDATQRFLAIRPEKYSVAYLREPFLQELGKTGDFDQSQVIGELTLETKNERTACYASGYHLTS